mmetsp:Transcript_4312/g.10801  ORF Transcript_4312/g.10801 Transcript_4312/m.10801 type:complete len:228 (-) Transcript_4312:171-854(-)
MHASLSTISASGTTAWPSTSRPPADASPAFDAPFVAALQLALIFFHPFSGTTNNLRAPPLRMPTNAESRAGMSCFAPTTAWRTSFSVSSSSPYPKEKTGDASPDRLSVARLPRRMTRYFNRTPSPLRTSPPEPSLTSRQRTPSLVVKKGWSFWASKAAAARCRPTSSHSSMVLQVRFSPLDALGGGAEPFTRAFARAGASSVAHAPPISWRRRWTRCGARAETAVMA